MTDFRRGKNCKAQFKKAVICQKEGDVRLAVVSISKLRSGSEFVLYMIRNNELFEDI